METEDLTGLSPEMIAFVQKLESLSLDRARIFGFFTMLGMYTLSKDSKDLYDNLNHHLKIDTSNLIDELVGDLYYGYKEEINELCYRSGLDFELREIKVPNTENILYAINIRNEGLLDKDITGINNLSDACRLFDSFILALGCKTLKSDCGLREAYLLGTFHILLLHNTDSKAALSVSALIKTMQPIIYAQCLNFLDTETHMNYLYNLENNQIAIHYLNSPLNSDYQKEFWVFQSSLFFKNQILIPEIDELDLKKFHAWTIDKAIEFNKNYLLLPYSQSNSDWNDIPEFEIISSFEECNNYIHSKWGYTYKSLRNYIETLEYKALTIMLIYFSLTKSRDKIH
jgi:hypothetical protein